MVQLDDLLLIPIYSGRSLAGGGHVMARLWDMKGPCTLMIRNPILIHEDDTDIYPLLIADAMEIRYNHHIAMITLSDNIHSIYVQNYTENMRNARHKQLLRSLLAKAVSRHRRRKMAVELIERCWLHASWRYPFGCMYLKLAQVHCMYVRM